MDKQKPKLSDYDLIVLNSSGGKDSQTTVKEMVEQAQAESYPMDRVIVVHADLRRMEWKGTKEIAKIQADHYGLRFEVISRELGDLLDQVQERGMWPDSQNRYCTSDQKRDQISKVITAEGRTIQDGDRKKKYRVLNVMGMRAEESPRRKKLPVFEMNKRISTKTRHVDNYLPIHAWTEKEVWASIMESGVPYHWAYDEGMSRLSCVFCVFASESDLMIAGRNNRELLDEYIEVEREIDHTFRKDFKIESIRDALEGVN